MCNNIGALRIISLTKIHDANSSRQGWMANPSRLVSLR